MSADIHTPGHEGIGRVVAPAGHALLGKRVGVRWMVTTDPSHFSLSHKILHLQPDSHAPFPLPLLTNNLARLLSFVSGLCLSQLRDLRRQRNKLSVAEKSRPQQGGYAEAVHIGR